MANNPFLTPTSPWTIVHSNGLLFNTSARVTRLQSRWASPTGAFVALKSLWGGTQAVTITGFGYALKYLGGSSSGDATSSYTNSLSESVAGSQFETDNPRIWSQSVPYTYAWCKGALSGAQNTALLSRIESNQASLETNIGTLGKWLPDGVGNGNVGMSGYVFNWCAADGQAGITDRSTNVRNLVQNTVQVINEQYAEGIWSSYDHIFDLDMLMVIAFHIATGNESLLATRCPAIVARGEQCARMISNDGNHIFKVLPHNVHANASGLFFSAYPFNAWSASVYSDITRDLTTAWVRDRQLATCTPTAWSHGQLTSEPTWLGFLFYDSGLTGVSPATSGLAKNNSYVVCGAAQFRSAWDSATEVVCDFFGGNPLVLNDHDIPNAGCIQIRVGNTWLVSDGYAYCVRRAGAGWELGSPVGANEVGGYTMRSSGVSFSPSATEATRVDRDGSGTVVSTPGSSTKYPSCRTFSNFVRSTWDSGAMGAMYDDGTLAKVTADISVAFQQCTSVKRTVGWRGSAGLPVTIIVYDQFTAAATINQIRANFWSKFKPTVVSETILQGSSSAGVMKWGGDHVIFKNGSYQATIQIVTPFNAINGVGGAGYESFFDAPANATTGYATSGGANLDFVANGGAAADFLWMNNNAAVPGQIQWRASFQTTQATALGEMLYVITVDAVGTTAPSYTKAQALALLQPASGGPNMPGLTQASQRISLDYNLGTADPGLPTLWCGLMLTVPSDDGTGGVEVSGTAYARVAVPSGTFGAATGGSPATASNASAITFAQALSDWAPALSLTGWALFKASSGGTAHWADYLGTASWSEFTTDTALSPGVYSTGGAHGLSNNDLIAVTAKYGGTLPTLSQGSWSGILTVKNVTTTTFTLQTSGSVALNTSSGGGGSYRKVVPQSIVTNDTYKFAIGALVVTQA